MKRKFLIILLAIISVIACALGLTACNVGDGGDNSVSGSTSLSGTYYLYENGKLDKSQYITFNGSKWSDDDSVNGTFTLNETTIVFYAEVMGSKEEMFSGTLSDGKLTVKVLGSTMTYYKEGSEPNGSTGGNDTPTGHTHSWDKTWSSDDKYHWYACSGCNEKKDEAQHYYVDGKCVCGKENDNQGNTPSNKEFEVTFNLNYTGATSITQSTEDKLITYIPTRNGYEFNGWYLDSELMHYFDTAEQVTANGLVLYACWVEEATEIGQLSAPVINVVNNVFSWKSIAGATGYRVIVTASASKTDLVDETVRTTNWTFPVSFDAGVYAVKIRAIGDGITTVNSVYSSRNFSLRVLNAVTGIALDRATSLLTWNEVENAEEYNVYVGSKLVSIQTETSFDMSNFDAGSLAIKITATKENWLTSQGSATLSKMRLKTPEVIVSVDPATNSYILKWDSVKYADTYVLIYGEKEIEIKATNYTIDKNSAVWGGNNTTTFTVDAFDSKADYLISAGSKDITINKIFSLNIEKSIEDAGSTAFEGNVWQPITVSFNLNGASGSVASQTVTTTKGLTYPSIPTRSGYIFRGWFTEKSCENLYDFTAEIKNNLTLYAGWQSYSGTFIELNSGSKSYSSNTSYKYYYFRALSDTQIKIGYSQTSSSPTSYLMIYDVTKGSAWTDDQSFKNTTPGTTNFYPTAGHVYYIRTHSSTSTTLNLSVYTYPSDGFLPNDGGKAVADYVIGTSSNEAINCVLYNNEYTLTATTKSGYTWVGWFDGATKLTSDLTYTFTMPAKEVTYTAKWIKVTVDRNNTNAGSVSSLTGTYKVGDEATITASTYSGYTFVGWYNGETKLTDNLSYTFTMPSENVTYTAKWIKVTISKSISAAGSVSSLSDKYKVGDQATITATTNNGYTWLGWYNGETELTKNLSYTFTMPSEDVTYTAKWTYYTLSTSRNNTSAGTVTSYSNTKITAGEEITITATTKSGYTFVGWYNGETELTKDLSYTFTMPSENATYTAKWIKVTTARSSTSAGTVTSLTSTYKVGDEAIITATTNNGYTFVGWYNGETELTKNLSYTFIMPSEDVTYTAKWTYYTLSTSSNNTTAGTVTSYSNTKITAGEEITITATTKSGYTFVGWYNGDTELSKDLSYTFTMPSENVAYTAKWTYYTLSTSSNSTTAGTVTSYSNTKITAGEEITITATTKSGYTFVGWYNGDTELSKDLSYTFTMPSENVTYTAKWIKVNVISGFMEAGSVTALTGTYKTGEEVTITAITNSGYTFIGWYNGDTELTKELSYTFSMPVENTTYTAKWIGCPITLVKNIEAAGTVSGVEGSTVLSEITSITATTNTGYTWLGWYNGEEELTKDLTYTFVMTMDTVTYTAKWTYFTFTINANTGGEINVVGGANSARISFNLNGASGTAPSTQYITQSEGVIYPEIPTRNGYVFAGWYENASCTGNPFDFSKEVNGAKMLYAKWIQYSGNGVLPLNGNITIDVVSKTNSTKHYYAFVPLANGNISVYSADGLSDTYGYLYDSSKTQLAYDDDSGNGSNFKITYSVTAGTLYYVSPCGYNSSGTTTVYLSGDLPTAGGCLGDAGSYYEPVKCTVGEQVTITAITNSGYTWLGWYKGDTLLTAELSYTFNMRAENVVFTAQWIKVTVEQNNINAGLISSLDGAYKFNDEVTITAESNFGFTWLGWYSGEELITTELSYTFNMPSADKTYTAKWGIPYLNSEREVAYYTGSDGYVLTSSSANVLCGWYLLYGTVTGGTLTVSSEAHIILANNCNWKLNGIVVTNKNTLEVYAQSDGESVGKLTTTANIGGSNGSTPSTGSGSSGGSGGIITIYGGTITATNIGGGNGGNGGGGSTSRGGSGGSGGAITINGGTVTATNIGGGDGGSGYSNGASGGNGGVITINGGIVTATNIGGGIGGSGINKSGGGNGGSGASGGIGGTININGGSVTATHIGGGNGGVAGFGSGAFVGGAGGSGGTIVIKAGTVKATTIGGGNGGAGGAGGSNGSVGGVGGNGGSGGSITISGGTVNATNRIGGGNGGDGGSAWTSSNTGNIGGNGGNGGSSGSISIYDGQVTATQYIGGGNGGNGGAGYRGGNGGNGGNTTTIVLMKSMALTTKRLGFGSYGTGNSGAGYGSGTAGINGETGKVYYGYTESDYNNESISSTKSDVYFYSETQPTSGNYWHYVNDIPTIW